MPLFPTTNFDAATFELTLRFENINVPLDDFFWDNRRSITVRLPSYSSLVGSNHAPHRTLAEIRLNETSQRSGDPSLIWHYTYEHTQLLDKIAMLELLNNALTDIVQNVGVGQPQPQAQPQHQGLNLAELTMLLHGRQHANIQSMTNHSGEIEQLCILFLAWLSCTYSHLPQELKESMVELEAWLEYVQELDGLEIFTVFLSGLLILLREIRCDEVDDGPSPLRPHCRTCVVVGREVPAREAPLWEVGSTILDHLRAMAAVHPEDWVVSRPVLVEEGCRSRRGSTDRTSTEEYDGSDALSISDGEQGRTSDERSLSGDIDTDEEDVFPEVPQLGSQVNVHVGVAVDPVSNDRGDTHKGTLAVMHTESSQSAPQSMENFDVESGDNEDDELRGRSCLIFGPKNALRNACHWVVTHPSFDFWLMVLIALSILVVVARITIAEPTIQMVVTGLDVMLILAFIIEFGMKVIAHGFVCEEESYLRSPWNGLDFMILLFAISHFPDMIHTQSGSTAEPPEIVRMLRGLRILAKSNACCRAFERCAGRFAGHIPLT